MFENFKKEGRVEAADVIKLFASILVIFSHSMLKFINNGVSNPLFNFIWLTQMPLFMVAAGFVNTKHEKINSFKLYFLKELKNVLVLIVPCLSFLLLNCLIEGTNVGVAFANFYKNPESNLWFLWVLFVIHLTFDFGLFLSNKIKNRKRFLIPVSLLLFASLIIIILMFLFRNKIDFSILSLKLIAYYIPFYCFGFLFHIFIKSDLAKVKTIKIITYVVLAICFCLLVFECFYFKSIYAFNDMDIKFLLIRIFGSFSSVIICIFLANIAIKNNLVKKISKYGSFSLQAYYLHVVFLKLLNYSSDKTWSQWFVSFGTSTLLIIMVALSIIVIYYIPYLHLILFGRSFSNYQFEKKLPKIFL